VSKPLEEGWLLAPHCDGRGAGCPYTHQEPAPAAIRGFPQQKESTERIKHLQAWALGLYWVSLLMQSICIPPLEPQVGFSQEAGREQKEEDSSPSPWSCSGAVWGMSKLCAKVFATLWLLPKTCIQHNLHEENVARAKPHTPCSAPQTELQNPHPRVFSAKGQNHQIFPAIPAAG